MKIDRENIIKELFDFSQKGHGVVVGKPGIGKSFSLSELGVLLNDKDIDFYIFQIDKLIDGSDETLKSELEITEDWISYLDKIKTPEEGTRAVLIFDAFDAARSGQLRTQFIAQIRKAVRRLSKWNVIVSVRTYDATKSPQLQEIFQSEYGNGIIACRNYEIPELSEGELILSLTNDEKLSRVQKSITPQLQEILKVPFYLVLLEKVLKLSDKVDLGAIKIIKSQTELLELFWEKRISQTQNFLEKEKLLVEFTKELIRLKTLNCSKSDFTWDPKILENLLSGDILEEVGLSNKYLSYSHNILFDYAVSRLVIPDKSQEILEFISQDHARPFFLRPSFVFHLTRLWYQQRKVFWSTYALLQDSKDINITLFRRLLPSSVIAFEYDLDDLEEIIGRGLLLKDLFQSLRFLQGRNVELRDLSLLEMASSGLTIEYLWEFAQVLEFFINSYSTYTKENQQKIGSISRQFFEFVFRFRSDPKLRPNLDRLGSSKGVRFICKTFESDKRQSKELLKKVLDLLKEPNFEIWYFSVLCDEIVHLFKFDPIFVQEIYLTIYGYIEKSDEKTNLGTATLNLISNRRQDFNSCYYRLKQHFSQFLEDDTETAIETGLKVINQYVLNHELYGSYKSQDSKEIKVGSIVSSFTHDLSSTWHDMANSKYGADLINPLINFLEKQAKNQDEKLKDYTNLYLENANAGLTWKKWIEFAVEYSDQLNDYLFSLALNRTILKASETTYEIANAISRIGDRLTQDQVDQIVYTIWTIKEDENNQEYTDHLINKLLNCIPNERLIDQKSIEFLAKNKKVENQPTFISTFTSEPFTTDKWLEEKGVDLTQGNNQRYLDAIRDLESFTHTWLNEVPQKKDYEYVEGLMTNLIPEINSENIDKEILFSLQKEIAKSIQIITRNVETLSIESYQLFKSFTIEALKIETNYEPNPDDSVRAYSPTPRIESSGALLNLIRYEWDEELLTLIVQGSKDKTAIVRFEVLRNLSWIWAMYKETFWEIISDRIKNEKDNMTLSLIISAIFKTDIIEEDRENVEKTIVEAEEHLVNAIDKNSFKDNYVNLLLYLITKHNNKVARKIVDDNISVVNFSRVIIARIFEIIDPKYPNNNYTESGSLHLVLFDILKKITESNLDALIELDLEKLTQDSIEKERIMLNDLIVSRVFFALDIRDRIINRDPLKPTLSKKRAFYEFIKPILELIVSRTSDDKGIILAHTAHYFTQMINGIINFYPENAETFLRWIYEITKLSMITGYHFDKFAMDEAVRFTEKILADHKNILIENENMDYLVQLLNIYIESGWPDALESLWKLDEAFR